jgi:hypothetical protein
VIFDGITGINIWLAGFVFNERWARNWRTPNFGSSSSSHEIEDENDEGDHEQEMDEPASDVKSEPATPENDEENSND